MDSLYSYPLERLERYDPTYKNIEVQYGSSEMFTAQNMGTGLSAGSGIGIGTESAELWIWFALLVVHEDSHIGIIHWNIHPGAGTSTLV